MNVLKHTYANISACYIVSYLTHVFPKDNLKYNSTLNAIG